MVSYLGYRVLHLAAVFLILLSLGAAVVEFAPGGSRNPRRAGLWAVVNGVGLFLGLIGGFGLVVRLGISWPWPGWLLGKFVIWLALGFLFALVKRMPDHGRLWWWAGWATAVAAAYLAAYKPF
ncbi:MAG TPA: hypothetical protein P5568_06350 [Acidobacteriota bacterium]|nr:hypothetical protein [Acidobacteriota bacterium]